MLDRLDKLTQYLPDGTPETLSDNVIAAEYDYTVATDGTRTGLAESIRREDGTYATANYTWTYDALNRLLSETINSNEPGVSRTEYYAYDLAGNRIYKGIDPFSGWGFNGTTYSYDNNDRVIYEDGFFYDFTTNENSTTFKTYTYGHNGQFTYATQTAEYVWADTWSYDEETSTEIMTNRSTTTNTAFSFGLQGRLEGHAVSSSTTESIYTTTYDPETDTWEYGSSTKSSSSSSQANFAYNDQGIRVYASQVTTTNDGVNPPVSQATATLYLVDTMNPTGYAQVLEERTVTAAGTAVPHVDALSAVTKAYVLGMDVVQQWTPADAANGLPIADNIVILPDGHGSTRLLLASALGVLAGSGLMVPGQRFFYDAWGNLLAPVGAPTSLTTLLYTGEQRDTATGMYYLRARYYNPSMGRFASMDPWSGRYGSMQDYNGYAYVAGNPLNAFDPSGLSFKALGIILGGFAVLGLLTYLAPSAITAFWGSWGVSPTQSPKNIVVIDGLNGLTSWAFGWDAVSPSRLASDLRTAGHSVTYLSFPNEVAVIHALNSNDIAIIVSHGLEDYYDLTGNPVGGWGFGGNSTDARDSGLTTALGSPVHTAIPQSFITANELRNQINNPNLLLVTAACKGARSNAMYRAATPRKFIGSSVDNGVNEAEVLMQYVVDVANHGEAVADANLGSSGNCVVGT